MTPDQECTLCGGLGLICSRPGIDPFDPGKTCPECDGSGVFEVDLNGEDE